MTDQVPEYYHSVSERLSNILDNVGYSREDRDRKVRIAAEAEMFMSMSSALQVPGNRKYMLGSRGEGSTGPGLHSDKDYLIENDDFKVVTDLTDCHPDKTNFLMVTDSFTHPGYVKLQSIYVSPDYTTVPILGTYGNIDTFNRCILPSTLLHGDGIVSGPAVHTPADEKEYSFDTVHALRCSQWPREGFEWFQRRRCYGWPTPTQIEHARQYGCFATPVGHPHSSERHLEMRLSFSIAERELTRSFEDTTMKVYILLKMVKKTYIEPVVGDAFSSYHCKVCMLWLRERTPRELWRNENLLYCLILCIRQLYDWATAGFCPDYFIVTNNIYDRKIFGAIRISLVQKLEYLLSTDCRFLLGIQCCHLGLFLACWGVVGFFYVLHIIGRWSLSCIEVEVDNNLGIRNAIKCRCAILKHIPQDYPTLIDYLERLVYAAKHLPYISKYPLKHIMMVLWSQLGFHIATVCKENAPFLSQEQVDFLLDLALCCLSAGINIDSTSVRLKLCRLGIELENYDLTEAWLQHVGHHRMRSMYSATVDSDDDFTVLNCNMIWYGMNLWTARYSTEELMQTKVSVSVVYMPSEISIAPKPLRIEMFRSVGVPPELRKRSGDYWYDWGVVDSSMCLYFFQYVNSSKQGKDRPKQVSMESMIHVIRTESRLQHRETGFNLLGYSLMQENQLRNAFICFTQSLKIRPYHNAAKVHLGLLYKKVLVALRRHVSL